MKPELYVDLIKASIWPAVVVVFLYLEWPFVVHILETRNVELPGGVKIGGSIAVASQVNDNALVSFQQSVAQLQKDPSVDTPAFRDLVKNTVQDLQTVQDQLSSARTELAAGNATSASVSELHGSNSPVAQTSVALALEAERKGFGAIAAKDFSLALSSFEEAYRNYPTLHNVDEIRRLLRSRTDALQNGDASAWKDFDQTLLIKYSWGMPAAIRSQLHEQIAGE